jgi:hypothetical protein
MHHVIEGAGSAVSALRKDLFYDFVVVFFVSLQSSMLRFR